MEDLSFLISRVREKLSDVPIDYDDDALVLNDLNDAREFVYMIAMADDGTNPRYQIQIDNCTVNLAAFKNYLTYTSIAERRLGEMPTSALVKLDALRKNARACLSLISKYPLDEDLSVDLSEIKGGAVCGGLTPSLISG